MKKQDIEHILDHLSLIKCKARIQIIAYLKKNGPSYVNQIANALKMSQPAVSHHLKMMVDHGIAQSVKEQTKIFYDVDMQALESKIAFMNKKLCK